MSKSLIDYFRNENNKAAITIKLKIFSKQGYAILPPISSKVLKDIVFCDDCLSQFIEYYKNGAASFKVLSNDKGKKYYSIKKDNNENFKPLYIKENEFLHGAITAVVNKNIDISKIVDCKGEVKYSSSTFNYLIDSISIKDTSELSVGIKDGGFLKITFLTPTAIPTKIMLPPWASNINRRIPKFYRILPEPSFIVAYSAKLWVKIMDINEANNIHYYTGRLADVYMVEMDYNLRPETVIVGRDELNRLRLFRGFTGFAVYRVKRGIMSKILDKVLDLTQLMGLGKLKSLGMGEIKVEVLNNKFEKI
ncbi:MAG: CRISPR system precrRNA processing endoribonuclease RAMP protein Cas6 [Caldisphaera sp.]